jgi:hypothetical protein
MNTSNRFNMETLACQRQAEIEKSIRQATQIRNASSSSQFAPSSRQWKFVSANRLFTLFVAISLIVVIVLAVESAFAAKAISPQINRAYTQSNEWALRVAASLVEEDLASLSNLSRLNPCFDMPFRELARCHNALGERYSQTP